MSAACCALPRNRRKARRLFGVGGSVGPGVLLLLLPKCPACVAAYVAIFTGAGLAAPMTEYVRPLLLAMFVASVIVLLADRLAEGSRAVS